MSVRVAIFWLALAGCYTSDPIGPPDPRSDPDEPSGGSSATSSTTGSPTSGSTSSSSSTGTGTGGGPSCGDGVVDLGEECDDQNVIDADGCTACEIDCGSTELKDPSSGNCYAVFPSAVDRATAEASCQAGGGGPGLGHPASIGDQAENDLGAPLSQGHTRNGAHDLGGDWAWVDGTPYVFENFQAGEPNYPGVEHCMFMDAEAKWHDHDCADVRSAYLCERRGAGTF